MGMLPDSPQQGHKAKLKAFGVCVCVFEIELVTGYSAQEGRFTREDGDAEANHSIPQAGAHLC